MRFFKNLILFALIAFSGLAVSSCRVGEDDPWISFRSRDSRIKANWKMSKMQNWYEISTFDPATGQPINTTISQMYDGYDMNVKVTSNGVVTSDSTYGYDYRINIKDDGKLTYSTTTVILGLGVKSTGNDSWFWINTDQDKSRVNVGSAMISPLTTGINVAAVAPNLPVTLLISDFAVDGLRNEKLKLSHDKTSSQIVANAAFQTIKISSRMEFDAK